MLPVVTPDAAFKHRPTVLAAGQLIVLESYTASAGGWLLEQMQRDWLWQRAVDATGNYNDGVAV